MSLRSSRFNELFPVPQFQRFAAVEPTERMIALSIRQPYIELILRGEKTIEYRSLPTRRRGRIYLYASRIAADDDGAWAQAGAARGELPVGMLLGTVEIVDCQGRRGDFHWHLARPERLAEPLAVSKKPQPMFFYPW
ncbi:MAG TPA: ASCH domain-containing protein [Pirellulales bacterium]|nr:ASCH domain-containing protein [Pirellulales bacterium]